MMITKLFKTGALFMLVFFISANTMVFAQQNKTNTKTTKVRSKTADEQTVSDEHSLIGITTADNKPASHTQHPDAQWYPEAGLGLFLHWGISSVRAMNISWPMIPGRALAKKRIDDPAERERIIRESDYNLNGKKPEITPNEYWTMAKDFNPQNYDPDKWIKAAKEAGFKYVVLTTRHHEGFALWPSAYGDFSTKNFMNGRDLLKDYVAACRKYGMKIGFYYSPPNWYFDRDYMSFLYGGAKKLNPEFPSLDADLKPRTTQKSAEETAKHQAEFAALVKGQVEELLTRYGKIDLLWFDGKPAIPNGDKCISIERIHELQPGIVVNPRLHGKGDFITYERTLGTNKVATGWAEFCNTWTTAWPYTNDPYRSDGYVLGQFVTCRSLGVNYLLGIGPKATGELAEDAYKNMAVVAGWMKVNGEAVNGTKPLAKEEEASVPAVKSATAIYLFALPKFKDNGAYDKDMLPATDETITIKGVKKLSGVKLLSNGKPLHYTHADYTVTVNLPASERSKLVDVIKIEL
ncbi:MAG: alpha-L-fucosidase [Bacteroidota bacterium]|nr:alpha-L-fucosidase [Bacteroidota bacterium]